MNNQRQQQEQQSHSHNHQNGGNNNNRGRSNRNRKSKSPKRQNNKAKSRSPKRNQQNKSKSPMRNRGQRKKKPAAMTVIVNRCDLWDSAAHFQPDECFQAQIQHTVAKALPYKFEPVSSGMAPPPGMDKLLSVATARVPHQVESIEFPIRNNPNQCEVIDTTIPNPHDPDVVHDKYWAQRR